MDKLRIFKNDAIANAAVRRNGLHGMNYETESHCSAAGTGRVVRFFTHDREDADYVRGMGYFATVDPARAAD
jgi:hypothetical protein